MWSRAWARPVWLGCGEGPPTPALVSAVASMLALESDLTLEYTNVDVITPVSKSQRSRSLKSKIPCITVLKAQDPKYQGPQSQIPKSTSLMGRKGRILGRGRCISPTSRMMVSQEVSRTLSQRQKLKASCSWCSENRKPLRGRSQAVGRPPRSL